MNVIGLTDPDAVALVQAWARWDAIALRPPKYPPPLFMKAETDRLVDLEVRIAERLGVRATELHDGIVAHRRTGSDVEEAVGRYLAERAG